MTPSHDVLDAFDVTGEVEFAGDSVCRVGDFVFKIEQHAVAANWIIETLAGLTIRGIRLPKYRQSHDGDWLVDGWSCQTALAGTLAPERWEATLEVARRFHGGLKGIQRPGWMDSIDDPWRTADRMAWGELMIQTKHVLLPMVAAVTRHLQPTRQPSQLVHGDLAGNVLHAPVPAVIDPTLYWRPVGYAEAIVAIDCYQWEGVDESVLEAVAGHAEGIQMLLRAFLFRMITDGHATKIHPEVVEVHDRTHKRLLDLIE